MTTPSGREEKPEAVVAVAGIVTPAIAVNATARMRMNFSVQHLLVAARLAREVASTEKENSGRQFGSFYDVILGSSVSCVLLSTAAAEAYVNEIFADRAEHFSSRDRDLLDMIWDEYEQKRVLDKFDLAHRLRNGGKVDRGTRSARSLDRLVKLRNALTHFKPEWADEAAGHLKLSKQLEGYVGRSPWLLDEPLFPRAWATAATTTWAVATVVQFIGEFSSASEIPDRTIKFRSRLDTSSSSAG